MLRTSYDALIVQLVSEHRTITRHIVRGVSRLPLRRGHSPQRIRVGMLRGVVGGRYYRARPWLSACVVYSMHAGACPQSKDVRSKLEEAVVWVGGGGQDEIDVAVVNSACVSTRLLQYRTSWLNGAWDNRDTALAPWRTTWAGGGCLPSDVMRVTSKGAPASLPRYCFALMLSRAREHTVRR